MQEELFIRRGIYTARQLRVASYVAIDKRAFLIAFETGQPSAILKTFTEFASLHSMSIRVLGCRVTNTRCGRRQKKFAQLRKVNREKA